MLSAVQKQLNDLASRVQTINQSRSDSPAISPPAEGLQQCDSSSTLQPDVQVGPDVIFSRQNVAATSQRFYGPTSPDYAFNVARLKLRQKSLSGPPDHQLQLASIDDENTSESEETCVASSDRRFSSSPRAIVRADTAPLLTFRSFLSIQETIELLQVYDQVVGDFHPVVDATALIAQTRFWYADKDLRTCDAPTAATTGAADHESLLILNMALAIALRADSKPIYNTTETLLRDNFQDAVNAKLAAPAYSIRHVTIILLKVSLSLSLS